MIVDVPETLIVPAIRADLVELGAGPAFGSRVLPYVQELNQTHVALQDVNERLAMDIFMFDWWIRNADRTLTIHGGNPNLLFDYEMRKLVVIDHNQAFDDDFNVEAFFDLHVFADIGRRLFDDPLEQSRYCEQFARVLACFDDACDNVPAAWWWFDEGVPTDFDLPKAKALLMQYTQESFWRKP